MSEADQTPTPPDDHDDKRKTPSARFADVELGPIPMGPGATPLLPPVGVAAGPPPATPATFMCLRGPCRHYWELKTFFDSGNPDSTWDPEIGIKDAEGKPIAKPRQVTRTCLAHPGTETEITDDTVFDCNRWSPLSPREAKKLDKARRAYFKRYPEHEHDPSFVPASRLKR